jgi:hypothetical protein
MSTRTFFKRTALVVVTALSFGALASAPSYSSVPEATTSVALSASSGSVISGETSTAVTVTVQFTPTLTTDTVVVTVVLPGTGSPVADAATTGSNLRITTDSANATIAYTTTESNTVVITPGTANAITKAVLTYTVRATTTTGVFGYTVQARLGSTKAVLQSALYTLTVAANDDSASPSKSNLYINKVLPSGSTYIMADSALVVSAGQKADLTLMTPSVVGYAMANFRNAAGDSVVATNSTINVNGTMVVKITSGPGFLSRYETATATQLVRQITIVRGDSIVIWNDGSAGIGTITAYIGGVPLSDPADTIKFYGKAEKFVATANAVTAAGWNLSTGSDSATSGTNIITFVATDAAGLTVPSASQNRNEKFYVHSSDTTVVRGFASKTAVGECNAPVSTADQAAGKWDCDMYVIDSGTVTLQVSDSSTIASSLYTSNVIEVKVAGAAYKGTLSFAKTAVQTGENVEMTIKCFDRAGRNCGQPTATSAVAYPGLFNSGGIQTKQFIGGAIVGTSVSTGTATFSTVYDWAGLTVFFNGEETALVTMPLTTGDVVIDLTTGGADMLSVGKITLVVTNAEVTASTDAGKAATAAAEAATDAAAEAIDAANAATDAANLAAEAADAATVAAEEARDAADAATAAVEELATQVATLMAALQAQIKTLANTVAKIAKKVKA